MVYSYDILKDQYDNFGAEPTLLRIRIIIFDTVCTVHRNQFYKQTKKMHFYMYLFYNLFANLHVSNGYIFHHQEFTNLLLSAALCKPCKRV